MPATEMVVDFTKDETYEDLDRSGTKEPMSIGSRGGVIGRPPKSDTKKAIRQRARRKLAKLTTDEQEVLWGRDISQWDLEELARARPRAADGTFKGKPPAFITRQLHEEITKRFETIVREEMNTHTVAALEMLGHLLEDDSTDDKGKPNVPASVKASIAQWLVEHVVGKPKQRTEADISVKLQGILGAAIANPTQQGYELTSSYIEVESWEDDDDDTESE